MTSNKSDQGEPQFPSGINSDKEILELLEPSVRDWWVKEFEEYKEINKGGYFTPPQRRAIPKIHNRKNTLVASPTGSGKTLSSFISIINELFKTSKEEEGLDNEVYCLYVSPLKSLANDIHKNLEKPLEEIEELAKEEGEDVETIRHAIRHGDTTDYEKSKMLKETPHILNTTPETLAILLNSPKFREKLKNVKWVIVDEIHALADNKRGVHLSLSLERLAEIADEEFTRIGCSATIEPLWEISLYLGGYQNDGNVRPVEMVDTRFVREYDLELKTPVPDLINTPSREISDKLYEYLDQMIQNHKNTLIFTNTRSGAERVLHKLRERYPDKYDEENSGCHHGSLSKDKRIDIEQKLKSGEIDFVSSSTSLELGIDMPYIDLVIQIGSPKSVKALLQRVGRSGHRVGQTAKGRVIALDRDELVECGVMVQKATEGFIDEVQIPERSLDVLTQHIYGMAINGPLKLKRIKKIVRRSYNYHKISEEEFEIIKDYMTAEYTGMEDRNIYAKIWHDEDKGKVGKRGKMARVIYYTNIGTIPDDFSCDVYTRGDKEWVGKLDEQYLDTLEKGDVFVLGGEHLSFRYRRGSKVYVDKTSAKPNVPSWYSERLPLSYDLGKNILKFKKGAIRKYVKGSLLEWLKKMPIDANSATSLNSLFDQQIKYQRKTSISTPSRLVVEEHEDDNKRYYYFRSNYGRKFNDGLSRIVAYQISKRHNINVTISIMDTGFVLGMSANRHVNIEDIMKTIKPEKARKILRKALEDTNLLKRIFRINATRSLMILKNYKGNRKSAKRQQMSADMLIHYAKDLENFAPLEETYREIIEDRLELEHIKEILNKIQEGELMVKSLMVTTPTPLSFGLATLKASDAVLAEDKNKLLKEFHKQVIKKIES